MNAEEKVTHIVTTIVNKIRSLEEEVGALAAGLTSDTEDLSDLNVVKALLTFNITAGRHQAMLDLFRELTGKTFYEVAGSAVPDNSDPRWTVETVPHPDLPPSDVVLITNGLKALGQPELVVAPAPIDFLDVIKHALNVVAEGSLTEALQIGGRYAIGVGDLKLKAERFITTPSGDKAVQITAAVSDARITRAVDMFTKGMQ